MDGTLVTIEGIDKAGKGTVTRALREEFDALFTTEPRGEDWTGKVVYEILRDERESDDYQLYCTFLVDHMNHVNTVVQPAMKRGELVVCDRYMDSRYAYQMESLADEIEAEDTLAWLQEMEENRVNTIIPDLTLFIDISPEEAIRRMETDTESDRERFEKKEFLTSVRENYHRLVDENERFTVIDGEQSKEAVVQESIEQLNSIL